MSTRRSGSVMLRFTVAGCDAIGTPLRDQTSNLVGRDGGERRCLAEVARQPFERHQRPISAPRVLADLVPVP